MRVTKSSASPISPAASRSNIERARWPGAASGTSASLDEASRSVVPLWEKWTTRLRPSIAVTRPVPSSELKRWVRWSPTDQACTHRFYRCQPIGAGSAPATSNVAVASPVSSYSRTTRRSSCRPGPGVDTQRSEPRATGVPSIDHS